jgi:hypothetical protein
MGSRRKKPRVSEPSLPNNAIRRSLFLFNVSSLNASKMERIAVASVIAPLWVPLLVTITANLLVFTDPEDRSWLVGTLIMSIIFGYGGTLLFGLRALVFLQARNLTAFWVAPVAGFAIGTITWSVFLLLFALCYSSLFFVFVLGIFTLGPSFQLPGLAGPGVIGALVGATFWLIARPDRCPVSA